MKREKKSKNTDVEKHRFLIFIKNSRQHSNLLKVYIHKCYKIKRFEALNGESKPPLKPLKNLILPPSQIKALTSLN